MDPVRQSLYRCFGHATVLLPAKNATQLVGIGGGNGMTVAASMTSQHQMALWANSIAAVCGPASDNLAAITFRSSEALDAFLGDNPALLPSLVTGRPTEPTLWLRTTGFSPANQTFGDITWTRNGVILVHSRQRNVTCAIIKEGQPPAVDFTAIDWPPAIEDAFRVERIALKYPMEGTGHYGQRIVSARFIARYYAERTGATYDPVTHQFCLRADAAGLRRGLNTDMVMADVLTFLPLVARLVNSKGLAFPNSHAAIRAIVSELKLVALQPSVQEQDGLNRFVTAGLELSDGANVTVEELTFGYGDFCRDLNLPRYTKREFHNLLPAAIDQIYQLPKRHDIVRSGKARRGFRNLRLKSVSGGAVTDGSDDSDGGIMGRLVPFSRNHVVTSA